MNCIIFRFNLSEFNSEELIISSVIGFKKDKFVQIVNVLFSRGIILEITTP